MSARRQQSYHHTEYVDYIDHIDHIDHIDYMVQVQPMSHIDINYASLAQMQKLATA